MEMGGKINFVKKILIRNPKSSQIKHAQFFKIIKKLLYKLRFV